MAKHQVPGGGNALIFLMKGKDSGIFPGIFITDLFTSIIGSVIN